MLSKLIVKTIPNAIRKLRRLSLDCLDGSLKVEHIRMLLQIQEGLSQTQMAEIFQVSLPAISKMVQGLEEKGLVDRTPGEDRRTHVLALTKEGTRIYKVVSSHVEKKIEASLKNLTKQELLDLTNGLNVLTKVMDGV